MNRERAETFLRLLAEAELRDPLARSPTAAGSADSPSVTLPVRVARVAWALTAVGALDIETAEGILADVEFALAARGRPGRPGPGRAMTVGRAWPHGPSGPGLRPRQFAASAGVLGVLGVSPLTRIRTLAPGLAAASPLPAGARFLAAEPGAGGHGGQGIQGAPDRYVPVGLMILFHDETISGELDLMSYAHTASGARLVATWRTRDPLGSRYHGLPPVDRFAVTDDRGAGYDLCFSTKGRPESTCDLSLCPDPPDDIRWLDVTAPGEAAVRINLEPQAPGSAGRAEPEVSEIDLGAGDHLLNKIAERLLTMAPDFPHDLRLQAAVSPGPLTSLAAGLGDLIAALQAAEVLSPLSPVPGRLAALCASLRVSGHGITAAPAHDLPEPWLSLLAHYHRRKPDPAPARDGFAAVATALPELDGIRLVLLGLHHSDGNTWMNALAIGEVPDGQHGPLGLDMSFPLSIWLRDSAGRWHAAHPAGWYDAYREHVLTLRLVPPLTRPAAWIDVLAAGKSGQVRARLPLRWGYPP
jgi:hypothetical protein